MYKTITDVLQVFKTVLRLQTDIYVCAAICPQKKLHLCCLLISTPQWDTKCEITNIYNYMCKLLMGGYY